MKSVPKPKSVNTFKKLETAVAAAKKAVDESLAVFEKEGVNYHEALKAATSKYSIFQAELARKIAKLAYKIKKTEHKLAKAALTFAQKEARKAARKASKIAPDATIKVAVKATQAKPKTTKKAAKL